MDIKFLTNLDLNGNQLNNVVLQNLASNPSDSAEGRVFYHSGIDRIQYYTGSAWRQVLTDSDKTTLQSSLDTLSDRVDTLQTTLETITGEDTDTVINKWEEIVAFIDGTEGTTLDGILTSYAKKTGDTLTDVTLSGDVFGNGWSIEGGIPIFGEFNAEDLSVKTITIDGQSLGSFAFKSSLAYSELTGLPTIPTVINNLTSTSTTSALSAAQGKALNDKFASYLPLSGGTITGTLSVNDTLEINVGIDGFNSDGDTSWYIDSETGNARFNKVNNYTLAAACAKGVTDATSSTTISSTDENLITARAVWHGLPLFNNSHVYNSNGSFYVAESAGTANQYLISKGTNNAPVWQTGATTVTSGSSTLITSGGVYTALQDYVKKSDLQTSNVIHEYFTASNLTSYGSSGYYYKLQQTSESTNVAGVMLYDQNSNVMYTAISQDGDGTKLWFNETAYEQIGTNQYKVTYVL